ncbi:MAG: hypothetical protein ABIB41_12135 [Nitrospirota bacterium]
MDIGNFLKSLVIDTWYKALMYLGGVIFAVSLFVDVKGIGNVNAQLLSGSAFLLGLGEWKNHKIQSWIKPPNVYTGGAALMSTTVRKPDIIGIGLDVIGVALLCIAIWKIVRG